MATHQLRPFECPVCHIEHDAVTNMTDKEEPPDPGDVSVCLECGAASVFMLGGHLRMPNAEEAAVIRADHALWPCATRCGSRRPAEPDVGGPGRPPGPTVGSNPTRAAWRLPAMPLDPHPEPVTDLADGPRGVADYPFYARVEHRADGQWGVQIRGMNHQPVWGNMEGWGDLDHTLQMIRALSPNLRIVIITDEETAPTTIEPGQDLP